MVKLMRTLVVWDLLMTVLRLRESGSQRNYILMLEKNGGSGYGGSPSRVDAVTSQEQAGKCKKLLHLTLLPTASCFLSSTNSGLCRNGGLEVLIPSQPSHPPHHYHSNFQKLSSCPRLWAEFPGTVYLWDLKECLLGLVPAS